MTQRQVRSSRLLPFGFVAAAWAQLAGAAPPTPTPTYLIASKVIQAKVADLTFKEVQFFFPAFNQGFHIAPMGGPGKTAPLSLIETADVTQGTPVGPAPSNGAPTPLAVGSCLAPVKMAVRVWVDNAGNGDFNATDYSLGLDGEINNAQLVHSAFGLVGAGQTKYVEVSPFSFTPGNLSFALVLNKSQKGNETNFKNNYFQSSFFIGCKHCPPGEAIVVSTGLCKRVTKVPGPGKP